MLKKLRRLITPTALAPTAIEQRSIQLAGRVIPYTLKRSGKRRSIGLRIDDKGLTVAIPLRASEKWLHSVLQEKARWVVDKLESWQAKKPAPQQWVDGAAILYRGETFVLRVVPSLFACAPQLAGRQLVIHADRADDPLAIEKIVEHWYRREALQLFTECVAHYAPLLRVAPREIRLSAASTQWGSCTARGVVHLNWRLVKMPLHLVDYVVAHELAHLVEMNHSAAFWRVVQVVCPNYVKLRGELRKWSPAADA
jgi:predicted metal-dependent hydrolase